jgi:GPI mannosyltransferase 4
MPPLSFHNNEENRFAQTSWSLYNFLILFRVGVAPFLTGYIHPDEFFQGGQEVWFGCPPYRTWEFHSENALRSVVPPTIMTRLPLQLCAKILGVDSEHLPGVLLWIVPRVACAIISIAAVDGSIWALSRPTDSITNIRKSPGVPLPVLMVASAWPTMVILNRPFTNAMETWILALLFRTVLFEGRKEKQSHSKVTLLQCLVVGVLSALGIFTRFTFIFFAFPIIVYLGFRMLRELGMWDRLIKASAAYFAFLFAVGDIMERDAEFYGSSVAVLTPWNALSYNSKVANLQEHGIHPRWTHSLVNMFLLYGPMTLMAYLAFGSSNTWLIETVPASEGPGLLAKPRTTVFLCKWIIFFGLGVLSLAPHQEPRFLLPLIVPISLLSDNPWMRGRFRTGIVGVWIIFNGVLLFFFGVLHQSGVVPSLLALGSIPALMQRTPAAVVFYHVYMPPTFLSRTQKGCRNIQFIDLNGSHDLASLGATLSESLHCSSQGTGGDAYLHLISSPFVQRLDESQWYLGDKECIVPGFACESIWDFGAHLSLEDPPPMTDVMRARLPLSIYEISCNNN